MNATQLKRKLEEAEEINRNLKKDIGFLKHQNRWLCEDIDKIQDANKKIRIHNLRYNFYNGSFRDSFHNRRNEGFQLFLDSTSLNFSNRSHTIMVIEKELTKYFSTNEVDSIKKYASFIRRHFVYNQTLFSKLACTQFVTNTKQINLKIMTLRTLIMDADKRHVFETITQCGQLFSNVVNELEEAVIDLPTSYFDEDY